MVGGGGGEAQLLVHPIRNHRSYLTDKERGECQPWECCDVICYLDVHCCCCCRHVSIRHEGKLMGPYCSKYVICASALPCKRACDERGWWWIRVAQLCFVYVGAPMCMHGLVLCVTEERRVDSVHSQDSARMPFAFCHSSGSMHFHFTPNQTLF